MKKTIAAILSAVMMLSPAALLPVSAEDGMTDKGAPTAFTNQNALYVHAVSNSSDANAWQAWQSVHDEYFRESDTGTKYFFLPTSAGDSSVDIYNAYSSGVTINGVQIASHTTESVPYSVNTNYSVTASGRNYTVKFMKSNAEAALYINNSNADGNGTDLMTYLNSDKSLSAAATGAIVTPDGKIDNTAVSKIKGRGNTTWGKPKKAYNITYAKKLSFAGMEKNKKFSLLANYQDDSLSRNRFLYDLSDAVGLPYASDSRYVDFYVNGYYRGSYQMCEKVGQGSLVNDIDTDSYLNTDGTINEDFPFICEVDGSAGPDDYYVTLNNGVKITLKDPEIDPGQPGYNEVLAYVKQKFENFTAVASSKTGKVSDVADLASVTKLYLINELGKNWDSGASSIYFTYKQDENGVYKFYGSPVWDYDNSLGNATGVGTDLSSMGVNDYTSFSGWWCRYKGKRSSQSTATGNIINNLAWNNEVLAAADDIWFDEFVPAINHFAGKTDNPVVAKDLYSAEQYYDLISGSAEMNYRSGWLLNTGSWISNHSSVRVAEYDLNTNTYQVKPNAMTFSNNFTGMYDYAVQWMLSRSAWLSSQMAAGYGKTQLLGDVNRDGTVNISDATEIQRYIAKMIDFSALQYELGNVLSENGISISDVTAIQRHLAGIEPLPGTQTDPVQENCTVTFTNTLGWSGDIYCYYYNDTGAAVEAPNAWPGLKMTAAGTNTAGQALYTIEVPKRMTYVMFTNNIVQTIKIPFDGSVLNYYAIDEVNEKGRYYYGTF
ncbi:MAG: CotH kinase family protein [Ruminococcus sp.]|nr:CotH kinase family protein [Ruminococcus sp.]